jgi:hypothetical protein
MVWRLSVEERRCNEAFSRESAIKFSFGIGGTALIALIVSNNGDCFEVDVESCHGRRKWFIE